MQLKDISDYAKQIMQQYACEPVTIKVTSQSGRVSSISTAIAS